MHSLIKENPSITFTVIAILPASASEKDKAFKYALPNNVKEVQTLFLGSPEEKLVEPVMNQEQFELLEKFFLSRASMDQIFPILSNKKVMGSPSGFFNSRVFWEIVQNCYEKEGLHSSFIDYFWMIRNKYEPIISLIQSPIKDKFNLVHSASTGYAGVLGAFLSYQQDIPYLVTEHGIYSREREEEILQSTWVPAVYKSRWINYFHYLSNIAYSQASKIISLFDRNATIQERVGASKEKIMVIGNGVNIASTPKFEVKKVGEKLHIGAIVRIVPIKDILTMLQAAHLLKEKRVNFHLYIFGPVDEDPSYAEECQVSCRELNLTEHVTFTGKINVADWIPKMDLFLLTSISEGQPMAILEGFSYGKPFVATNVGNCRGLVEGEGDDSYGKAGEIVPPVNAGQLAEKITQYANNPQMLVEHGMNGFKRVKAKHLLEDIIHQYANLYKQLGGK
ncbi:DUF3492 domain-containing protein [Mangrovibacillus cuniculi]|uniref:DUF3492 domain-containing protein n=1 Tax=Mangrovibacillus cuniculi TaxID=2593652 RepID=A0A7S8CCZ6_9BACI|nr:DUF3492 domain-containing protein [Mangrovibacillus cuniculi]